MTNRLLILFLLVPLYLSAQHDSVHVSAQKTAAARYVAGAGSQLLLFQGSEQLKYPLYYQNDPHYSSKQYETADLWYAGHYYPAMKLRFDRYRQELIVQTPEPSYNVVVDTARFDSAFTFGSKLYYLKSTSGANQPKGYFMMIYNGKHQLYMQPRALLHEYTEDREIRYRFDFQQMFFIRKAQTFHPVQNIRDLMAVFPESANRIKSFIRSNKLNFRKNPEETLVEVLKNSGIE